MAQIQKVQLNNGVEMPIIGSYQVKYIPLSIDMLLLVGSGAYAPPERQHAVVGWIGTALQVRLLALTFTGKL
jgi:hypothetical protein